jgi:hypothetical protein
MALSSCADEEEEIEDTDPRRNAYPVCSLGGEPLSPEKLIRRWLFAWAAAVAMGPGYAVGGCG